MIKIGYGAISFNSISLNIDRINVVKRQKTIKQTIGKNVVILGPALAVEATENVLSLRGRRTDASKDATKTSLEDSQDGQRHAYTDGLRSGDYAILSLNFNDAGGTAGISQYVYNMTLVEW